MSQIRFYLDENIQVAVEEQLRRLDIDVVSAHSLGYLQDDDINHLRRAISMGRVLCTHDADFLVLAGEFPDHSGIIWAAHERSSIGGWVRELVRLHGNRSAKDLKSQVKYISAR